MDSAGTTKPDRSPKNVNYIGGIPVEFPFQPYGSQLAFMSRVISTLDRAQREGHCHALLESPTGTGKSLSLLCSALAWQRHRGTRDTNCCPPPSTKPDPRASDDPLNYGGGFLLESQHASASAPEESPSVAVKGKNQRKKSVTTIFYASRTHSQISQVIREYRKTTYRLPMAVLASRKHYCTNKNIRRRENLDEECKLLMKNTENGCPEFKNASKVKCHPSLQVGGCNDPHDIEDLVKVGQRVRGCSYFAARSLSTEAHLVFCPYSYIINPIIRRAMEVDIQGAVIILDEAHNIEDIAREAGSLEIDFDSLLKLQMELSELCLTEAAIYQPLYEMILEITSWMQNRKQNLEKRDFQHYFSSWTGDRALKVLQEANLSPQCFPSLQECATKAIKATSDTESGFAHLSGMSALTLEGMFSSLSYIFLNGGIHIHDYQVALRSFFKRDAGNSPGYWTFTFNLWCLNPAVVFKDIADASLSVILTSGTLSPMNSFSSELGVQFSTSLEAPHVIDVELQAWAAAVSTGPGSYPLNASYKTADGYAFQDALGKTLEEIFTIVPGGSLVFFPSYKLMDKVSRRWHETGQWSRLTSRKPLFVEPKGGGQDDLEPVLKGYYDAIRLGSKPSVRSNKKGKKIGLNCTDAEVIEPCRKKGAAFLAVCRGKVSEGIDFSDEYARAVIVVGIPFPNINDIQVCEKKKYNDLYKHSKQLLSGSDWYCHQAFRALNQAAGRCIRHRFDHGAIIFLDERYREERTTMFLSKWLRKSVRHYDNFETSMESLKSFFKNVKEQIGETKLQSESSIKRDMTCDSFGKGSVRKNQKLNDYASFPPIISRGVDEFRASSLENLKLCGSPREIIDLEDDFQESSRYSGFQYMRNSSDGIGMAKGTADTNYNCNIASSNSLSKDDTFSSTTIHSSIEVEDQTTVRNRSIINTSAQSPLKVYCSLAKTPERNTRTTVRSAVEVESPLNTSVNSYAQKKRKSINLVHENSDFTISGNKNGLIGRRNVNKICCTKKLDDKCKSKIPQSVLAEGSNGSFLPAGSPMDQRLQLSCSLCKNPLGLPENQFLVTCSIILSSKVMLNSLFRRQIQHLISVVPPAVEVVVVDISTIDQKLYNGDLKEVTRQGIWSEEDGCMYDQIFCPFCNLSNNCLGVRTRATDASRFQLLNTNLQVFLYYDRVQVMNPRLSADQGVAKDSTLAPQRGNMANIASVEKYAFQPPLQISGGWRSTKTKLRLPRRALLRNTEDAHE